MITTIRRGEVYHFATMDPAVLDEVRDIEWAQQTEDQQQQDSARASECGLVGALRRLFGRSKTH